MSAGAGAGTRRRRAPRPPRPRGEVHRSPDLARARAHHDHPNHPVRHRGGRRVRPAAPTADPPRRLGRPRREPPDPRSHRDPAAGRPPPRRGPTQTPVAVVVGHRSHLEEVDQLWQTYLRRFDLEHTFRFFTQTLGWTRARTRSPETGDRPTQIIIAAHTQLRLSRHLTHDLRRPWERPIEPDRLTPARIRRGFRNIRGKLPSWPAHRNPHDRDQDAPQDHPTPTAPPDTTPARRSKQPQARERRSRQVKRQAEPVLVTDWLSPRTALVGLAARANGVPLSTRDARAVGTYAAVGAEIELVGT